MLNQMNIPPCCFGLITHSLDSAFSISVTSKVVNTDPWPSSSSMCLARSSTTHNPQLCVFDSGYFIYLFNLGNVYSLFNVVFVSL
ncbi:hypothetical protein ACLB2K_013015 [Fragaria x ananassa]